LNPYFHAAKLGRLLNLDLQIRETNLSNREK
jgi:hypothetical protein